LKPPALSIQQFLNLIEWMFVVDFVLWERAYLHKKQTSNNNKQQR
jgi:hypothetical protein